jgi:hypothetical protein
MQAGRLTIRPLQAKLLHDTEMFGKMSPYVKVCIGDQCEKTPYAKKGHMAPTWDADLSFQVLGDELITFECWHHEKIFKDDFIGSGTLSLSSFLSSGRTSFNEWIPLFYKDNQDAGSLEVSFQFFPGGLGTTAGVGLSQTNTLETRTDMTWEKPMGQTFTSSTTTQEGFLTQPKMTTETKVITHEPIITKETPIVYEKNIIHEKPIITERTIVHSEQPIIIEKPELHERIINEQAQPIVKVDQPIIRQEEGLVGEAWEGTPVVHTDTQYVRDQAEFYKETPVVHQKDVILEKPIIHEKDIVYREKPIIVEKPEIVEKHMYETQAPTTHVHDTLFTKQQEFTTVKPQLPDAIVHKEEAFIQQAQPIFKKELPDVHETEVIHEKRLIHEKPIVHTEKEIIHEKPELHEKRIFHQDQTIKMRDPLVTQEGMPQEGIAQQPKP